MTAELTTEQVVTNLLISNDILKPADLKYSSNNDMTLGEYLSEEALRRSELKKKSRYAFIELSE